MFAAVVCEICETGFSAAMQVYRLVWLGKDFVTLLGVTCLTEVLAAFMIVA